MIILIVNGRYFITRYIELTFTGGKSREHRI